LYHGEGVIFYPTKAFLFLGAEGLAIPKLQLKGLLAVFDSG
jgi:hypothetical protein